MGDRTSVSMTIHPDDMARPEWEAFVNDNGEGEGSRANIWEDYECNYALDCEREELAKAGIRFYGIHGTGGDYGGGTYFADGTDAEMYREMEGLWKNDRLAVNTIVDFRGVRVINELHAHEQLQLLERYRRIKREIDAAQKLREAIEARDAMPPERGPEPISDEYHDAHCAVLDAEEALKEAREPTATRLLQEVLSVTELNLDDMEPETRKVVQRASGWLADNVETPTS